MRSGEEIDGIIARRAEAGDRPYLIADRLDLPVADVRARLVALGFPSDREGTQNKYAVHPKWDSDPHELRLWIWQRQRDGAAATLRGRP